MKMRIAVFLIAGGLAFGGTPAPAVARNPLGALCNATGRLARGINPCGAVKKAGGMLSAGKKLLTGHPGAALGAAAGTVGSGLVSVGLTAVGFWVLGGAKFALDETAKVLGSTTSPQLRSTWFSATYWRMAGISAVLTLPFLFAAAVQALLRADLSQLARAALIHLPLSVLLVSIAAPITMLLLAASDEMSAIVSGAAGNESAHFLDAAGLTISGLSNLTSPFLAFLIGVFTVAGALVLWIELLMRETAVYVIVLMLPLAFAAFVWPARRIWAVRTLELLGALILSKFAIVAVLSLGGAALGSTLGHPSVANWLAGLVLVLMAAFMPWALLRLVPLAEIASSAAGPLRRELQREVVGAGKIADASARHAEDFLGHMRDQAQQAWPANDAGAAGAARDGVSGSAAPGADAPADEGSDDDAPAEGPAPEGAPADGASAESAAPGGAPPDEAGEGSTQQAPDSAQDAAAPPATTHAAGAPSDRRADDFPRGPRPPRPYDDTDLLGGAPHSRDLWFGVSEGPSFRVEPNGDTTPEPHRRSVAPRADGSNGNTAPAEPGRSSATDETDPLPPPQEDPEGRL